MALTDISGVGPGGTGFQGVDDKSAAAALTELAGLTSVVLTGTTADTKIDVAAIRSEDTIVMALNDSDPGTGGLITDILSTMSINTLFATGTVTASTIIAGSDTTINGKLYTFQAGAAVTYGQVQVGADDDGSIANLKTAVESFEGSIEKGGADITVTNATNVLTVTAAVEGTGGNSIALLTGDASIVVSGATLAGGTATGGVQSTGATDKIIMMWYNKK